MNNKSIVSSKLWSVSKTEKIAYSVVLTIIGTLFISLFAQLKINLPFTPIPITGGSFGILLIGLIYGKTLTFTTVSSYIIAGFVGAPVFANAGSGNFFLIASGGYIVGYFFAALLCSYFADKGYTNSYIKTVLVLLLANVVLYSFGLIHLAKFVGTEKVLQAGLIPFIPGDIFKIILATVIASSVDKIFKK